MPTVFKIENGKHVSFELKLRYDGIYSSVLFSDTLGYAGCVSGKNINEVISNEIKAIEEKIKTHPKESALRWVLSEVKKEKIKYLQLTLF